MSNYPESINPGDPTAPWNLNDSKEGTYYVSVEVKIKATSHTEATDEVMWALRNYNATMVDVFEEGE